MADGTVLSCGVAVMVSAGGFVVITTLPDVIDELLAVAGVLVTMVRDVLVPDTELYLLESTPGQVKARHVKGRIGVLK